MVTMAGKLEKIFSVNISDDMDSALTARARQDGVSRGEVVRLALDAYLANGKPMGMPGSLTADEIADAVAERLKGMFDRPAPEPVPAPTPKLRTRRTTSVRAKLDAPGAPNLDNGENRDSDARVNAAPGQKDRLARLMERVEQNKDED
jgi:hypothetical protein